MRTMASLFCFVVFVCLFSIERHEHIWSATAVAIAMLSLLSFKTSVLSLVLLFFVFLILFFATFATTHGDDWERNAIEILFSHKRYTLLQRLMERCASLVCVRV